MRHYILIRLRARRIRAARKTRLDREQFIAEVKAFLDGLQKAITISEAISEAINSILITKQK